MGKISAGEDFGQAVAAPLRLSEAAMPRAAFGVTSSLRAVAQQLRGDELQAEHEAETAVKARATRILTDADTEFVREARKLSEDIAQGKVRKDDAATEWSARTEILRERIRLDVPDRFRSVADDALNAKTNRFKLDIEQAVRLRARTETRADLDSSLEALSRLAGSDRPSANEQAVQVLANLGPAAGLDDAQLGRLAAAFRETTAEVDAKRLIRAAKTDRRALDAVEQRVGSQEFYDLSPQARERLEGQIVNARAALDHQQEIAQRRAEAAAARRLTEAEHATRAVQTIIDGGSLPDADMLAQAQASATGTPYAATLKALVAEGGVRAGFGALAPAAQQQQLMALRNQIAAKGTNPALQKRLNTLEGIAEKSAKLAETEPLQWGVQTRRLDGVAPLQFDTLDQLLQGLAVRVDQARTVGAELQRPVSPLLTSEAARAAELLSALPLGQQTAFVRRAAALPVEQQRALATQLSGKDPALGLAMYSAAVPTAPGVDVPGLMLRGSDARKAKRIKTAGDDASVASDMARMAQELNAVPWATPKARDAAVTAAGLVYDGLRDTKGSASRRDALRLAVGELADWGDGKVPVPPGWTESRFRAAMRAVDAVTLQGQMRAPVLYVNGAEVKAEDLARALKTATLIPVSPGRYAIDSGGLVVDAQRRPFVFELRD